MKIIITRENLLRQMPVGMELPAQIILDGLPYDERQEPMYEYPDVFPVLTNIEWEIFCELADRGHATARELAKYLRNDRTDVFVGNNVSVHIKTMRKKLKEWVLPYSIKTRRQGMEKTMYILEKI
jgi:hypothetical protein